MSRKVSTLLTPLRYLGPKGHNAIWLYVCECQRLIARRKDAVESGAVYSCGCINLKKRQTFEQLDLFDNEDKPTFLTLVEVLKEIA